MVTKAPLRGGSLTVKPKGKFLLFLRQREPYRTQKSVEDATAIPNLRLSLYERGQPISLDHLHKLARFYDIPARELVEPDSLDQTLKLAFYIYQVLEPHPVE